MNFYDVERVGFHLARAAEFTDEGISLDNYELFAILLENVVLSRSFLQERNQIVRPLVDEVEIGVGLDEAVLELAKFVLLVQEAELEEGL